MRIRQHVNPLRLEYQLLEVGRVEPPPGREVEVEIGCADAQFLFERAAADPRRFEIGVEIRRELVEAVNRRAADEGAAVVAVFANANVAFSRIVAPGSLARVFVNFPDPWFKTRQKKRRVMEEGLVAAMTLALRPGGELFFQSDIFELAIEAMEELEASPELVNQAGEWSFWKRGNPYGARSRREVGCEEDGEPVWRMLYLRR